MRILISGGAGFIGQHLVRRLKQFQHDVWVIDNLSSGPRRCEHRPWINADISDPSSLNGLPKIDLFYNLACPASPPEYQRQPTATLDACYMGTKNMLKAALVHKAPIVQASTSEIYGDPIGHGLKVQNEDYWGNVNSMGPRSCYDEGKRVAETLCYEWRTQYGVDSRVARIFNTFGPGMPASDGRVVSNFAHQLVNELPITIYGTGKQTRSFCYVDRLVDMLVNIGFAKTWDGLPMNIGDVSQLSMADLANKMKQIYTSHFGSPYRASSPLVFQDAPKDDPAQRLPDLSRYLAAFGPVASKVSLDEGLLRTMKWMKEPQGK